MKTIQVSVAGRDYTVTPLPIKKNREWRKQFEAPIQDAANLLSEVGGIAGASGGEFEDGADMINKVLGSAAGNIANVAKHLLGSADMITEAVFDYSPALKKDRKYIEENGYDTELVSCFLSILGLAFPFGQAIQGLLKLGREEPQTEASSASPSSESETTN